ncbi:thiamine diphosphokinase [Halonatronum saccharophilum]|uniref:thiamine diphosphokinase n=1 Tax=Halonatronum saccharophilum TaxID=150060 RepID=UPI000482B530|nr:thiamine diphosphokinase [Halonatronum saccharophilum]
MSRAVIFINGDLIGEDKFYKDVISDDDSIYCADGGAKYTYRLNLIPELILGDLDSLSPEIIDHYNRAGVSFSKFPKEKDKTDTELLIDYILKKDKYNEIIIFAALGGRLDHSLANILLLEKFYNEYTAIKVISPKQTLEVIKSEFVLKECAGKTISLLSLAQKSKGVSLSGFKYDLEDGEIYRSSTLGMSNIVQSNLAKIKVDKGSLLLVINNS